MNLFYIIWFLVFRKTFQLNRANFSSYIFYCSKYITFACVLELCIYKYNFTLSHSQESYMVSIIISTFKRFIFSQLMFLIFFVHYYLVECHLFGVQNCGALVAIPPLQSSALILQIKTINCVALPPNTWKQHTCKTRLILNYQLLHSRSHKAQRYFV